MYMIKNLIKKFTKNKVDEVAPVQNMDFDSYKLAILKQLDILYYDGNLPKIDRNSNFQDKSRFENYTNKRENILICKNIKELEEQEQDIKYYRDRRDYKRNEVRL